jgi:small GTP-binding protein
MDQEEALQSITQAGREGVTSLDLSRRGLTMLPREIGELRNLRELYLEGNDLRALPIEIGHLVNLQKLNLENNELTSLPSQMGALTALTELQLSGNPLPIPPEILALKHQPLEIINYNLRLQREARRRPLNAAKLILLGEGGVGKTSLMSRLMGESSPANRGITSGVAVKHWQLDRKRNLRLNVWDFGGQGIFQSTLHLFLTPRTIYLLVLDSRKGIQENIAEYWLTLIQSYAGDSPIIVVNNKTDLQKQDLDEAALRKKYSSITSIVNVSVVSGAGISEIRRTIRRAADELVHLKNRFPLSWYGVRSDLEQRPHSYISYKDYLQICEAEGISDEQSQTSLLALMHDLGEVIYFSDDPRLRDTVIIRPEWAMNGIYRILSSQELENAKGLLQMSKLERVLPSREYPSDKHTFLLALIEKFEIGFALPESGEFLFPSLLPSEPPNFQWDIDDNLLFRYNYSFLPDWVIASFIARAHQFIAKGQYWKHGALLKERRGPRALVQAEPEERTITLQVSGSQPAHRELIRRIREQFNYIHQSLFNIEVSEETALVDYPEQFVSYEYLINLVALGKETFVSPVNFQEIDVKQLLDRIAPDEWRKEIEIRKRTKGAEAQTDLSALTKVIKAFAKTISSVFPPLVSLGVILLTIYLARKLFPSLTSEVLNRRWWTTVISFAGGILGTLVLLLTFFAFRARSGKESFLSLLVRLWSGEGPLLSDMTAVESLQENYSIWVKQIEQSLLEVNTADLKLYPKTQRSFVHNQFIKDYKHLNLTFNVASETLEVSELGRLNKFKETWNEAKELVEGNRIEPFRVAADKLTGQICTALNFKLREENSTQSQLYGHMIDASNPAFDLDRIRENFPFIFAGKMSFNESDVREATGLLNYFKVHGNYFALLIAFFDSDNLRRIVQASAYKNNFIVLNHDQVWEIMAATSSVSQLKSLILEQIDLTVVSPYETGGAVSGKAFFGRAEEEKRILEHISDTDFVLLANRKAGKTSLINKVVPLLNHSKNFEVISCDLQAVIDYETFYDTFHQSLEESEPAFAESIPQLSDFSPAHFPKLIAQLRRLNGNRQIIIVFDEVDALLSYDLQFNEQLFKTFRSLAQAQDDRVHFMFSGTSTLVQRARHPASPFFNFCEEIKVGLLGENAATELVVIPMERLNIRFEDRASSVKRILDISARHPNIIQWICDKLIHLINERQKRSIVSADVEFVLESPDFYDEFSRLIWGEAKERPFLRVIVYGMWSYSEFQEADVQKELANFSFPTQIIRENLETLEIYSILTREGPNYRFTYREFGKLIEKREDIKTLFELAGEELLQGAMKE